MAELAGKTIESVVFDAYGTLFDVHSAVMQHAAAIGPKAQALSDLWRVKQLEYTWIRTLSGHYKSFWQLTEDALDFSLAVIAPEAQNLREPLLASYRVLEAYEDAKAALDQLRARGFKTAILSNGDIDLLEQATSSAGLGDRFDALISVETLRAFKTAPEAYHLVEKHLGTKPAHTAFISSNRWDVAGASSAGFVCFWLNRTHKPDEYRDLPPFRTITSLADLVRL
jgi:2-haloacid dehalogenase